MNQNDAAIMDVLYVVERDTAAFEAARAAVDIVCAGDSLTGWNNFGPAEQWPYRTYPDFLQELCVPRGRRDPATLKNRVAGMGCTLAKWPSDPVVSLHWRARPYGT